MAQKKLVDAVIDVQGPMYSDYFQGAGGEKAVGIGYTPREALNDAFEMLAQQWDSKDEERLWEQDEAVEKKIEEEFEQRWGKKFLDTTVDQHIGQHTEGCPETAYDVHWYVVLEPIAEE